MQRQSLITDAMHIAPLLAHSLLRLSPRLMYLVSFNEALEKVTSKVSTGQSDTSFVSAGGLRPAAMRAGVVG